MHSSFVIVPRLLQSAHRLHAWMVAHVWTRVWTIRSRASAPPGQLVTGVNHLKVMFFFFPYILPKRGKNNSLASVLYIVFIMFSLRDNLTLRKIVETDFQFITWKNQTSKSTPFVWLFIVFGWFVSAELFNYDVAFPNKDSTSFTAVILSTDIALHALTLCMWIQTIEPGPFHLFSYVTWNGTKELSLGCKSSEECDLILFQEYRLVKLFLSIATLLLTTFSLFLLTVAIRPFH